MSIVVDLSPTRLERSPHKTGKVCCKTCGHSWVAIAPLGMHELECPSCGSFNGRFVDEVEAKAALEVLESLRLAIVSGQIKAFAAVGIEPDHCTRMWSAQVQPTTKLEMIGAMTTLLHNYQNDMWG